MIYQTDKYKLVIDDLNITITTYDLPIDYKLVYYVYNKSDYNLSEAITTGEILSNDEKLDNVASDGEYTILIRIIPIDETCTVVNDDSIGYIYYFKSFAKFKEEFIELSTDIICNCETCKDNKLSDCDSCIEEDLIKNNFNSFIFIIFYFLYYSDLTTMKNFIDYLKSIISKYELKISDRFYKMINYGAIRGSFELNSENQFILVTAIYIYIYLYTLQNSDYNLEIKTKFNIDNIKKCIYQKGLDYNIFEQKIFEFNFFGSISNIDLDCSGNTNCENIIDNLDSFIFDKTKQDFINGISFNITENVNRIVIVIPKVWDLPLEILDDSNTNIISIFSLLDINGNYVYVSTDINPVGQYIIKLKYNE